MRNRYLTPKQVIKFFGSDLLFENTQDPKYVVLSNFSVTMFKMARIQKEGCGKAGISLVPKFSRSPE